MSLTYGASVRGAGLVGVVGLGLATGCLSSDGAELLPEAEPMLVLVVRSAGPGRVDVEVHERVRRDRWLTEVGTATVHVLVYDRALAALSLRADAGLLVQRRDGIPLPRPQRWLTLEAGREPRALDPSTLDTAVVFPELRVPPRPCETLREDRALRIDDLSELADLSLVAALDERRALVAAVPAEPGAPPFLALTEASGRLEPFALSLGPQPPLGFVDPADGALWVALELTDSATTTTSTPALCRFALGGPVDAEACRPADFGGARPRLVRLSGYRVPGGPLRLAAVSNDGPVYVWRESTAPSVTWSHALNTGALVDPACEIVPTARVVVFDGLDTGWLTAEGGYLRRFDLSRAAPLGEPIFERPSCRAYYTRHPLGHELLVRVEYVSEAGTFSSGPELWLRAPGATAWTRADGEGLEPRGMLVVGETILITGRADVIVPWVLDAQRPEIPPRRCTPAPVFNDGSRMWASPDGQILIAGEVPNLGGLGLRAVGRWQLVAE
jgi:hypothetical protein